MAAAFTCRITAKDVAAAAIMRRMQAGDETAFAEFVELTRSRVTWEMRLRRLDYRDWDDCLQAIYMEFWERRRRIWPESAIGYLMRIAGARIRATRTQADRRPDQPVTDPAVWKYLGDSAAPGPEHQVIDLEAAREARRRCTAVTAGVPEHLRPVLTAYIRDESPQDTARRLGLTLLQVWDMTLEALAAARQAAGAPAFNRELETRLQECGLWPADAAPLPADMGQVLRRLPDGQRAIVYCRLTGLNTVETARTLGLANIKSLQHIARTKLHRLAECLGVIPAASPAITFTEAGNLLRLLPATVRTATRAAGIPTDSTGVQLEYFPALWTVAAPLPLYQGGKKPSLPPAFTGR